MPVAWAGLDEPVGNVSGVHRFRVGETSYVYSAGTGAVLELDEAAGRCLEALWEGTAALAAGGVAEELAQAGLLASVEPAPAADFSTAPVSSLVAIVSEACNLACAYCYAGGGRRGSRGRLMSAEVGRKAIDFLLAQAGESPALHVTFFGGEPLLNMATVTEMVAWGQRAAVRAGKQIGFSVTTNGSCFTQEVVRFLDEQRIGVVVSIDGPPAVHDRFRVLPSGAGSYEVIAGGLKALFEGYHAHPVKARVTVTRQALDLVATFLHLRALGFSEVAFCPVSANGSRFALGAGDLARFVAEFERLAELFVAAAMRGELLGVGTLISILRMIHLGERKHYPCGAGIGLVAVDAGGRLSWCHRCADRDAFLLGTLEDGLEKARRSELQTLGQVCRKEACRRCWAWPLCGGGCHYDAWLAGESLVQPDLARCRLYRGMIEVGLLTYVRLSRSAPAVLRRLLPGQAACAL